MENNYDENRYAIELSNRQPIRLVTDSGTPLKIVPADSVEKSRLPFSQHASAQKFVAELENVKNDVVVLRCYPLNFKSLRLESGCSGKPDCSAKPNMQDDMQNIENSLRNLYCYMKDLKKAGNTKLDLTQFLNILCRLQDIRDTFRDFKESMAGCKCKPKKPKPKKKVTYKKEKCPEKKSSKIGCFGCGSKKKKQKPFSKVEVPCMVIPNEPNPCQKQSTCSKSLTQISICSECTCGQENQGSTDKKKRSDKCDSNTKAGCLGCSRAKSSDRKSKKKDSKTCTCSSQAESPKKEKSCTCLAQKKRSEKSMQTTNSCTQLSKVKPENCPKKPEKCPKKEKTKPRKGDLPDITIQNDKPPCPCNKPKGFCECCYGKDVPIIKKNLAKELKKVAGKRRGTVFLKISAIEEDLFHIHMSTPTHSNVGCIYVTDKAMQEERKKRKAFNGYVTICIAPSTCDLPNVKKMVDYPFELCDR